MKLGITKDDLPDIARSFCTLISGAGVGMFLAVGFIPKDDRKIFQFQYFVVAQLLGVGGAILRWLIDWIGSRRAKKDLGHEKPVA